MRQIRFRFDGQPINETDTPAQVQSLIWPVLDVTMLKVFISFIVFLSFFSFFIYLQLEMEDEDTIDVFQQQTGGLM